MTYSEETLECKQGSSWAHGWAVTFNHEPINSTWTVSTAVIKRHFGGDVYKTFTGASVSDQGAVVISLNSTATDDWDFTDGYYLVKITKGNITLRVAQGRFILDAEV